MRIAPQMKKTVNQSNPQLILSKNLAQTCS